MDPQMLAALGMMGQQQGMPPRPPAPIPPVAPGQMMGSPAITPMGPPAMPPGGAGAALPPMPTGDMTPQPADKSGSLLAAGARSNPGLMLGSTPQTPPQAGTYESGPKMAGDGQNTPTNQEPTGENPQRPQAQNALPHFPRNRFGAMLLPRGGQIGGGMGAPPSPTGAFNWQNMLGQFLQRQNAGTPPTVSGM